MRLFIYSVSIFKITTTANTRFFCKQHYYKQLQAEMGKKSNKC